MNTRLGIALASLVLAGLASCARGPAAGLSPEPGATLGSPVPVQDAGQYYNLRPDELQSIFGNTDFLFVNVHVPDEGDIPGTDLSIPFDQVEQRLAELPQDREAMIVLYCRSGSMSSTAAQVLVRNGYSQVYNLEGGFRAWRRAGYNFNP